MSSDDDDQAPLRAVIAESDLVLEADRDSADPVAIRRVSDALYEKARALGKLERRQEAVEAWGELLAYPDALSESRRLEVLVLRFRDIWKLGDDNRVPDAVDALVDQFDRLERPERRVTVVLAALAAEQQALRRLGRTEEADRLDDQIIERGADDRAAIAITCWALRNQASRLLKLHGRVDDAIAISERLRSRIDSAPEETLSTVAEAVRAHLDDLVSWSSPGLRGAIAFVAVVLTGVGVESLTWADSLLLGAWPRLQASLAIPDRLDAAIECVEPVGQARRRMRQALAVQSALIARSRDSHDPELQAIAATTRAHEVMALMRLGRAPQAFRTFDRFQSGDEPGAIQALQSLADHANTDSVFGQQLQINLLRSRAIALGRGVENVARIAYDESIRALPAQEDGTIRRILARLFRPAGQPTIDVPDTLPDSSSSD